MTIKEYFQGWTPSSPTTVTFPTDAAIAVIVDVKRVVLILLDSIRVVRPTCLLGFRRPADVLDSTSATG